MANPLADEHHNLAQMIGQSNYSYGADKHLQSAVDHLDKSADHHEVGDNRAAHAALLVAANHFSAHLTAVNHPNAAQLSNAAQLLGNSYKHSHEL